MKIKTFCLAALLTVLLCPVAPAASKLHRGALRIFVIDVEGGKATLYVSPKGRSLLIDTGWSGENHRDADRIVAACLEAGVRKIDTVLITHYHEDHLGGLQQLMARIPVGQFLDHGDLYEKAAEPSALYARYLLLLKKHKRFSPVAGEKLNLKGFAATVVSSNGAVMKEPLKDAGKSNIFCDKLPDVPEETTERGHSLGIALRFGGVYILDLGDLTTDRERALVCPNNLIGHADLVIASSHGSDVSNSAVFMQSINPRVVVVANSETKGASTTALDTFGALPHIVSLYQLHIAPPAGTPQPGGTEQATGNHNTDEGSIANLHGLDGVRIDVDVNPDGSINIENRRTGKIRHLPPY